MSEVIGFRLDRRNPREALALSVIARWQEQGYSMRHLLTEALISLEQADTRDGQQAQLEEILTALKKVSDQFEHLQLTGLRSPDTPQTSRATLSDSFIGSVKNAARSGVRLDE